MESIDARSSFGLSISPAQLVYSEVLSVTSVMRKNSRWASTQPGLARGSQLATSMGLRNQSYGPENSGRVTHDMKEANLMAGFEELKRTVQECEDVLLIPQPDLLAPFLELVRSPLSTGPITSTALAAVYNFFVSGLITPNPALATQTALGELSNALAHCKFEASDSAGDEVVLLRIVNLIDLCQASAVGELLGDVELCEMLETVLTICCQMRLTETLRRSAETSMNAMVRRVFARLNRIDPSIDPENGAEVQASTPYGLPSAQELLRVLVNLLDPNDQQHTDSIRFAILGILINGLEASGSRIVEFPSLRNMLLDQGCKYLFQIARSENVNVLRLSLRAITTLLGTMQGHLKLQTELFLSFAMDRLAPPVPLLPPKVQLSLNTGGQNRKNVSLPGTPRPDTPMSGGTAVDSLIPEELSQGEQTPPSSRPSVMPAKGLTRELMLETLGFIGQRPTFMVDLWVNYDCDADCEDIFERLIGFLTRGVYPTQYTSGLESQRYSAQLLCLDLILTYVDHMAARAESEKVEWPSRYPPLDSLAASKGIKGLLINGATKFNTKPKIGLAFLEESGLIYKSEGEGIPRARTLAKFLMATPRLDKKVLGEWISAPENVDVLREFIGLFEFKGKSVADAMRLLLEAFRLPGEAAPIARITETFADIYFATKPVEIKSVDAVYVLAYSVIMLNTDLYNPQNRKRMTLEDYQKNLKSVNDGGNFDPAYLKSIYDSIKKREIILPEEHSGQLGFEYAWKALLRRTTAAGPFLECRTSYFDRAMFKLTWKSVVSAIAFAFTAFDDDHVVERAIAGFRKCAILAGHFQLPEVFDYVVKSLSQATGLLAEPETQAVKFAIAEKEGQSITVSPLSIKFGTNLRGQLAAVVLFTVANGNGNAIREGWALIFEMFQTLFMHTLLPPRMLQMEDFLGGSTTIPMQGAVASPHTIHRAEGGLLSALSSYLLTPYGASAETLVVEPSQDDIENTLSTMDCLASCKIEELYSQIMRVTLAVTLPASLKVLETEALISAVRALQVLADRRTLDVLVEEIISDPITMANARQEPSREPLPYDPSSVFLLETLVSVVCHTKDHIEETWPMAFEHVSGLLKNAQRFSSILIERAVVGLLRICLILATKPPLRDQIYLSIDLLRSLPPHITTAVAEQLSIGTAKLIREHGDLLRSSTEWGLVLALIRGTIAHPEAAKTSFNLLDELLTSPSSPSLSPDNFSGLISLMEAFAVAAGVAVDHHSQASRRPSNVVLTADTVIERGLKAVDIISEARKHVPVLIENSTLPKDEAWLTFWSIPLGALQRQSTNACRELRHSALGHLQRILLGPQFIAGVPRDFDFSVLFEKELFPLLENLLKPAVYMLDPQGMSETRLRGIALLCKSFLQFSVHTVDTIAETLKLWNRLLDYMDRFMNTGKRDQLNEAVPESLKNVVLVLHASQLLMPPTHPESRSPPQIEFWNASSEKLERFLPGFLEELIPAPRAPAAP